VSSVDEAKSFVDLIRRRYPDASHHVYAFAIGFGASLTHGMSDDGEPSGTAGRPVLAVLKGSGMGDLAVVITRYFGGTKLGTGGLVRAYTTTAQQLLEQTPRVIKREMVTVRFSVSYDLYEPCKKALAEHDGEIGTEGFSESVTLSVKVPRETFDDLREQIRDLTSGQVDIEVAE
jgi:uncharacterized YigZ family protein